MPRVANVPHARSRGWRGASVALRAAHMRFASIVVFVTLGVSTAHAGNAGILIPPLEFDIGVGAPVGSEVDRLGPSTEILAGLSWASLAWNPTRFDVGVGYVGSFRTIDDPNSPMDTSVSMHGAYLSLGKTLQSEKHWRTWFHARGELLRAYAGNERFGTSGAALRVSTELFAQGIQTGRGGGIVGAVAIGLYAEVNFRDVPAPLGRTGFVTGLSCRLPFLIAGG